VTTTLFGYLYSHKCANKLIVIVIIAPYS